VGAEVSRPAELERYLHDHIPLSKAMRVSVSSVTDDAVVLRAPLEPNINHRETVFGGSASALAILSAWSLLHLRLVRAGVSGRLVIQRNTMDYDRPIPGAFSARASIADPAKWPAFLRTLARRGKARITVASLLAHDGQIAGRFSGEFVALSASADPPAAGRDTVSRP
jgi:thioesterase domain-containing protein